MKLFIDDVRNAPDNSWTVARNYKEAISYLTGNEQITHLSFDHDLGNNSRSGYDIAKWIEKKVIEGKFILPQNVYIHSANPVGVKNILAALKSARINSRQ